MRLLIKIVIILAILFGAYAAYNYFVKGKSVTESVKDVQQGVDKATTAGPLTKAHATFKVARDPKDYELAISQYEEALKLPNLDDSDRADAMRAIGDCYYKMWDWSKEKDRASAVKAMDAYKAFLKKYPKEQGKVERAMERLRVSANLK